MISVIIPTYNCADYLVRSVSCALHQTFSDIEVIVVDDGSSDDSPRILRGLAASDSRLKVITTPNKGVAAARNVGLKQAAGEFLFFLDADDAIRLDALTILHDALNETGADVALSLHVKVSEKMATEPVPRGTKREPETRIYEPQQFVTDILYQTTVADHSPWGKLYRRNLFDGLSFPLGKIYEDLLIIPQVLLRASFIALVPAPLYLYTVRKGSLIHAVDIHKGDALEITSLLASIMSEESPELARAASDRHLSACFNIMKLIPARDRSNESAEDRENYDRLLKAARRGIRRFRGDALRNPKVRLKNRLAALLSYIFF